ncbi:beta-glucosidase family protein [Demequina aurantiaca]|uniref:beta-glucosidase family protein n=1 Tax=Demequina aurantiaca TaxID=676200 RepID=UPI000B161B1B|nr:glycoside hydrolase family 3 C-terminal domain-containing protein [Demequina aurantiaca]
MTTKSQDALAASNTAGESIAPLVAALSLEDKVRLLTGQTAWRLYAMPQIGLRSLAISDGPVGVRGTGEIPGATSLLMPSPSGLAATWNLDAARRAGTMFATEARRLGVDIVLAPQVNIQRTPIGGRHFECYSEDPYLTTQIAAAAVSAMQEAGVAACVKHYVANDSENYRTEYTSRVPEQALREIYMAPFEHLVTDVGVWSVMAAYNGADAGDEAAPMTEHGHLNNDVLKGEWGFDGVVLSDWMATNTTVESANGGLDLVMPGPGGPWEDNLLEAVRRGDVDESVIDDKVARILLLAERTGGFGDAIPAPSRPDDAEFLRKLAAEATVVLRRGKDYVVDAADVASIALIGPNAVNAYVLGGGSSTVHPHYVVSPTSGLTEAFPNADITLLRGGSALVHTPPADLTRDATDPVTGEAGIAVTELNTAGEIVSALVNPTWSGWHSDPSADCTDVVLETNLALRESGEHRIDVGVVGAHRIFIDGTLVSESHVEVDANVILDSSANSPIGSGLTITIDEPRTVRVRVELKTVNAGGYGRWVRADFRHARPGPSIEDEIVEAVEAARNADLTVLVVGTNSEVESEGWDRVSLALPGRQDELVRRVLEVAPDAIVVVNAGAPVLLPWLNEAKTVLWSWFPGQECGNAVADVITGKTEPAGRLPWTLPSSESDVPIMNTAPDADMVLHYPEGVHVGYREWERTEKTPAAPFGHGLGWTDFDYGTEASARVADDGTVTVTLSVTNTGSREGAEVVQAYVEAPSPSPAGIERPIRWLGGFERISIGSGETSTVSVRLPRRTFEVWDTASHAWVLPEGEYAIALGRSVRDLRTRTLINLPSHGGTAPAVREKPREASAPSQTAPSA